MKTLLKEIDVNLTDGYETAVFSELSGIWVKYGSNIVNIDDLPDVPQRCKTLIWNNDNIDIVFSGYIRKDN